jgi:predicted esterase YcpF (UPF0227 family)
MVAARVAETHPEVTWWCPQLPPSPKLAMQLIMDGVASWPRDRMGVIGSSLGGFYATYVAQACDCRAVLLNPAISPERGLAKYIGEQTGWHDPNEHFYFEPGYVDELRELHAGALRHPENFFAVIAKGDEVLDWREMTGRYPGARINLLEGSDDHIADVLGFMGLD